MSNFEDGQLYYVDGAGPYTVKREGDKWTFHDENGDECAVVKGTESSPASLFFSYAARMDARQYKDFYRAVRAEAFQKVKEFREHAEELGKFQTEIERLKRFARPTVVEMARLNGEIGPMVEIVRSLEKLLTFDTDLDEDDNTDFSVDIPQLFRELVEDIDEIPF